MMRILLLSIIGLVWQTNSADAAWCPFCGTMQGQTLVKEVQQARFVLYGTPSNPQVKQEADGREISSTVFTIDEVVKSDPFIKNKKSITLPRYIPPSTTGPEKLLVFCDLNNDQADTYLYLTAKDEALIKYLKDAIKLDDKNIPKKLFFYFNYLDHVDNEIATDAYKEFAKADYADVMKMVKEHGSVEMRHKLKTWLKDPNTAIYRFGLIGLMLGLSGKAEDGETFLSLLNDQNNNLISGIDGILAGYILVDQPAGWKYTKGLITSTSNDFNKRYAALRTLRFLWESHVGHVPEGDLLGAMEQFLAQGDIADLAIEDLRKWKQWKFTKTILDLAKRESHASSIVQRAVLRYMLCVPNDADAKAYVENVRKTNPDKIKDAQEILELEKSSETSDPIKAK